MTTITVTVNPAHLQRLAANPARAIAELIWNALDADAEVVSVELVEQEMGGVDRVVVRDDGHGMTYDQAVEEFKTLGASWKQAAMRSRGAGRMLHGRNGEGRWAAYGLGDTVRWVSTADPAGDGALQTVEIVGRRDASNKFDIDAISSDATATGTAVEVTVVDPAVATAIRGDRMRDRLTAEFALYLARYDAVITVDGRPIEPEALQLRRHDQRLDLPDDLGPAELTIIEWKTSVERDIVLCDEDGFALEDAPARFHAPSFHFTVYVRWSGFRERLDRLPVAEFDPELAVVLSAAREAAKRYFRKREDEDKQATLDRWKAEGVYPYEAEPEHDLDRAERALFDIVALTAAPAVDVSEPKAKRFSFLLLRQAIERDPGALRRIIEDVLDLGDRQRQELGELLERTTLGDIIAATRQVSDRLDSLKGLEALVFEPDLRKVVKERSQLHRIVAAETWIFGEEYALTADDESLTTVLKRHLKLLGREHLALAPVKRLDDSTGIVDLMLSRVVERRDRMREHLVIELKAPRVKVGGDEINQIKSYAHAVAEDPRFASSKDVRWEFWVVSTEVDKTGDRERNQRDRPFGLVYESEDGRIRIWVKTWGEIISDCEHRMKFFQAALNLEATRDEGVEYLRTRHAEFIPESLHAVEDETPAA